MQPWGLCQELSFWAGRSCGRRGYRLHCWARHFPLVGDERTPNARPSELAEAIRVNGLQRGARSKRQQASTCSAACRNREASARHIGGARGRKFYATCANLGVIQSDVGVGSCPLKYQPCAFIGRASASPSLSPCRKSGDQPSACGHATRQGRPRTGAPMAAWSLPGSGRGEESGSAPCRESTPAPGISRRELAIPTILRCGRNRETAWRTDGQDHQACVGVGQPRASGQCHSGPDWRPAVHQTDVLQ